MTLPADALHELCLLLRRRIGLAHEAVGSASIEAALQVCMRYSGIATLGEYASLVRDDEARFQELVEQVVVPETWFFRDGTPFRCLQRFQLEWRSRRQSNEKLRVLSIPCSTGEEPYSIAMILLHEGWTSDDLAIDAVDISERALQRAAAAQYTAGSFRQADAEFDRLREPFVTTVGNSVQVCDRVRQLVRFQQANLVSPDFRAARSAYDVIFCRNLLIYMDPAARRSAMEHLHGILDPQGLLYVGHVEAAAVAKYFVPYCSEFPFAFRRSLAAPDQPPAQPTAQPTVRALAMPASGSTAVRVVPQSVQPRVAVTRRTEPLPPKPTPAVGVAETPARKVALDPVVRLRAARDAADQGQLEQAAATCEQLIGDDHLSAEAFCLLGVVRQASGQWDEAERQFHKALYLDPRHTESLTHLMLLAMRRNDTLAEANIRRRLDAASGG